MLQSIVSCSVNPDNQSIPFSVHFVGGNECRRKEGVRGVACPAREDAEAYDELPEAASVTIYWKGR